MPLGVYEKYSAVPPEHRTTEVHQVTRPVEHRTMEVHQVTRPVEIRTTTKVEDDRSLGEKAKNALHNAAEKTKEVAHDIKEKLTPEVKDKDIAKAERKYNELKVKEDMDRFQAEGANERRQQLMGDAHQMQAEELANRKRAEMHREERHEKAEKVAQLQDKQNEQQAEKCHKAMMRGGACPQETKITRVTEIH